MSSTLYNKAFEVELMHNYYVYSGAPVNNEFKVNRNIAIVPTKESEELMKRGRLRFVPTMKGFTLFYQAYIDGDGNQQPLVKLSDDTEFTFAMFVDVNSVNLFYNVSDLDAAPKSYGTGKFYMLDQTINDNTPPPPVTSALTPSLANSLRSSIFSYTFKPAPLYTLGADVVILSGVAEVLVVENVSYNIVTKDYTAEIDLRDQRKGFYTLKAYKTGMPHIPANEINSNDFYVDSDLAMNNTFGVIRIKYATIDRLYDTTTNVASFTVFQHTFIPREVKWRYYIVVENLDASFFTGNSLQIKDESGGGVAFNASEPPPVFSQQLGKPDPDIAVNGLRTVIFDSQSDIAYSEKTTKNINLYRQPADEKMVSNLPNANPEGTDSDQYSAGQSPPDPPQPNISEIYFFI